MRLQMLVLIVSEFKIFKVMKGSNYDKEYKKAVKSLKKWLK